MTPVPAVCVTSPSLTRSQVLTRALAHPVLVFVSVGIWSAALRVFLNEHTLVPSEPTVITIVIVRATKIL